VTAVMTREPDTPPSAERTLQSLSDEMDVAREGLRAARDTEVEAEQAYRSALRKALLSDAIPKVALRREDGSRVTVAERDAWAADRVADEELRWQIAKATRRAAADRLNILKTQTSVAQSIGASVRESYRGTGDYR
jgi:hypothetical protein